MTPQMILEIGGEAVKTILFLAGPMLVAAMAIGVMISVMQAITQINEATLTFIPKILGVVLVLALMAPWMLKIIQEYATSIFGNVNFWIR